MGYPVAGPNAYFLDGTAYTLTTSFVKKDFGFTSAGIFIKNESGAGAIFWSVDGTNVAGKLLTGESLTLQGVGYNSIYLEGAAGGEAYRLMVW